MMPKTSFARARDAYLAYQVFGGGPRDIVVTLAWVSHIEFMWEVPEYARFFERLAGLGRVVLFDKRGVGMSDRSAQPVTLEERADDLVAVMDAAGSDRAVLLGWLDAGAAALVAAARHPDRVLSVVAGEVLATSKPQHDHPWGYHAGVIDHVATTLENGAWGEGTLLQLAVPALADDPRFVSWLQRWERVSATPSMAGWLLRALLEMDIRRYLPRVRVPVLLIHEQLNPLVDGEGMRWLADQLPDAQLRLTEARDPLASFLPYDQSLDEVEEFLEGTRRGGASDRMVGTLLFTDLVASTEHLTRVGDQRWRAVLDVHRSQVRKALSRHGGREIDTTGDGFFAVFALPSQALRCAHEIRQDAAGQGLAVRAGLHSGEIVLGDGEAVGLAVHAAARIAALARAHEVLMSDTVLALTAGTGAESEPAGEHQLKGLPGSWRLHRLIRPGS